jgi:ectoine hydroxylase-related dioxygenase (phytanoyl-CoA dioxygenase family)
LKHIKEEINYKGFAVIEDIFAPAEINSLLSVISQADNTKPAFRKSNDLFAIRQFLKEVPDAVTHVFNNKMNELITQLYGEGYFAVKSIYFDKPENSNWFVAYHQDLTISVDKKADLAGYGPWTIKQDQFAVQPPLNILEDNFTIRIHLDDTDEGNGALKVIPGSHLKGIFRAENID